MVGRQQKQTLEIKIQRYNDGGETTKQTLEIKVTATTIFGEATFKLHKWHSNNRELEVETATSDEESQSYAKQQLETRKGESKLLEVPWDKVKDEIQVSFPISTAEPTKRGILGKVAKIYDPLGLASPVNLSGKHSTEMPATRRSRGIAPYQVTYKPNGRNGSKDFQST